MEYLVIDLETGIKEHIGRNACYLINDVVAAVLKNKSIDLHFMSSDIDHIVNKIPDNIGIIVGHNIKFDLQYLWKSKRLQSLLKKGLKIWDTQLAEFMLTGQRHKYPALRDIAVNKYGCPEREKRMEAYWKQGIDTKNIPEDIVLYDVKYDGIDTESVLLHQVAQAKKIGMFDLIMLQMDGLLATTEMEFNGVFVNQSILETNKKDIENEIELINNGLKELAPDVENFNSTQQLSRLFFGGEEKIKVDEPILNELGLAEVVKSGVNRGKIKTKKVEKIIYKPGLGLKPLDEWQQKKEGIYRTDEGVLQILASWFRDDEEAKHLGITHPNGVKAKRIADLMLKVRGLNKLLGTYYEGTQRFIHKGDSCVHQQLAHCGYENNGHVAGGTGTGRLSCTKPNMQNQIN